MAAYDITPTAPVLEFDTVLAGQISQIIELDATHYAVAYRGSGFDGYVAVLEVNPTTGAVTQLSNIEYDIDSGAMPVIAKISSTKILCTYLGTANDGFAIIFTVNPTTYALSAGTPFEFDVTNYDRGALEKIDDTHFLLVWRGGASFFIYARVLEVNTTANTVTTAGALFTVESVAGSSIASQPIDANHFLIAYSITGFDCKVRTLEVNTSTWAVSAVGTPLVIPRTLIQSGATAMNALGSNKYLLTFTIVDTFYANSQVVAVNPATFDVTAPASKTALNTGAGFNTGGLAKIDSNHILVTYSDGNSDGNALVAEINPATSEVTKVGAGYEFDAVNGTWASSIKVSGTTNKVLIVWSGADDDGFAGVYQVEIPVPVVETPTPQRVPTGSLKLNVGGGRSSSRSVLTGVPKAKPFSRRRR